MQVPVLESQVLVRGIAFLSPGLCGHPFLLQSYTQMALPVSKCMIFVCQVHVIFYI